MAKKRRGVLLYFEHAKPLSSLPFEDRGRLFTAILEYGEFGIIPDFSGDQRLEFAWIYLKQGVDADAEEYARKCEQNRRNKVGSEQPMTTDDDC